MVIKSVYSGNAGEYYVAAELSSRGLIAAITPPNSESIDILASTSDGEKQVSIQVKTCQRKTEFLINKKSESLRSKKLFYVFVRLKNLGARPDFHIVPSSVVADFCIQYHDDYLSRTGKTRENNETSMRKFIDKENRYLEQWQLLGLNRK